MNLGQEYRESTAREIARLRRKHKLSMKELARRAGCDHGIISRIERGLATLSRPLCERIVEALDLSEHTANRLRLAAGYAPRRERSAA
jgi:transcriptional regulator with XRE-family HTH domain